MNTQEEHIILNALEKLNETTGIKTKFKPIENDKLVDGTVDIIMRNNKGAMFFIEAKRELRAHHLPAIMEQAIRYKPLLVIAETIFPKLKEELRKQDIAYLDDAGNAYINYRDLVVWIDGKKNEEKGYKVTNRVFTKAGLKVVFQLLNDNEIINLPYREIAKLAEVGLGNINYVMTGLKEMGYILRLDEKKKKLQRKKELLDRWMDGYAETLKPTLHIGNYRFANTNEFFNWRKIHFVDHDTVWGGEPGGDMLTNDLNPAKLTIYTARNKADIMKQFKVLPDVNGNITFYQKFWNNPRQKANHTAPPLLIYVDLMLTGDPRCQEIAQKVFNKYLQHEFK